MVQERGGSPLISEEVTGKLVESDGEESEKENSPEESEV